MYSFVFWDYFSQKFVLSNVCPISPSYYPSYYELIDEW